MAVHHATISWQSDGQFTSGKYSRAHDWMFDGGTSVRGSSSPLVVPLPMSDASAIDPEEALVASASACHMLWFLSLAGPAGLDVASYRDHAAGEMGRDERGRTAMILIRLSPDIRFAGDPPAADLVERLHHEAHQRCFIANSLRCKISVEGVNSEA